MKIITFIFILFLSANMAFAQTDCPFGLANDPAPGACARYIDANHDDYCDLSQVPLESDYLIQDKSKIEYLSEEELKQKTVKEVAEIYSIETSFYRAALSEFLKIDVKGGDILQELHDNNGLCTGVAANIALGIKNKGFNSSINTAISKDQDMQTPLAQTKSKARYQLLPITAIMIILYLISTVLVKKKKITMLAHHRFWNIILLFSFLATVILALFLIIRINWGWKPNLPFNMLYWHVETGTVMLLVSVFHLITHWNYYTCMIKKKSCKDVQNK